MLWVVPAGSEVERKELILSEAQLPGSKCLPSSLQLSTESIFSPRTKDMEKGYFIPQDMRSKMKSELHILICHCSLNKVKLLLLVYSRFSAFRSMIFRSRPVHSLMSSHRFLCLPLRLSPWTVPCRIVLASLDDCVTCPYHFSLRLFTEVRRSSYGPMACPVLAFISSLVVWSLYEILRSMLKHLISNACILLSMSAVMVHVSHAYRNMDTWPGNASVWPCPYFSDSNRGASWRMDDIYLVPKVLFLYKNVTRVEITGVTWLNSLSVSMRVIVSTAISKVHVAACF